MYMAESNFPNKGDLTRVIITLSIPYKLKVKTVVNSYYYRYSWMSNKAKMSPKGFKEITTVTSTWRA